MAINQEIARKLKQYSVDAEDLKEYDKVLNWFGYELTLINHEGDQLLIFTNEEGEYISINTQYHGLLMGFGFFESTEVAIDDYLRLDRLSEEASEGEEVKYAHFNRAALAYAINSLNEEIICHATNFTSTEYRYYEKIIKQYGVNLDVEFVGNYPVLIFKDQSKDVPTGFSHQDDGYDYIGFIFRFAEEEDEKYNNRVKHIKKQYRKDNRNKAISLLHFDRDTFEYFIDDLPSKERKDKGIILTGEEEEKLAVLTQDTFVFLEAALLGTDFKPVLASEYQFLDPRVHSTIKFPQMDIFIVPRKENKLNGNGVGLRGWQLERGMTEFDTLTDYDNVIGLIMVSNDDDLRGRKNAAKRAKGEYRHYMPSDPLSTVLTVDENLLHRWIHEGSPFTSGIGSEAALLIAPRDADTYGFRNFNIISDEKPPKISLMLHEPENQRIGGTLAYVVAEYNDEYTSLIQLDAGWRFDLNPSWSLGRSPSYADGIEPFLATGMIPVMNRIYRPDLFVQSLAPGNIDHVLLLTGLPADRLQDRSDLDEFIVMELYHHLGEESFFDLVHERMNATYSKLSKSGKLPRLKNYLRAREHHLYYRKVVHDGLAITHAHQDHSVLSSFLKGDILRAGSPITRSLLMADHKLGAFWWVQDQIAMKLRNEPKVGASYGVSEHPYLNLRDGKRIQIAPNIFITAIDVYHSIPGTVGFLLEYEHKGEVIASVAYPGDYRDGKFFERLGEMGVKPSIMLVEGTNPPKVKKDSVSFTEKDVRENFAETFEEARSQEKLMIVDIVKNNFERLMFVIDEAMARGRTVAISPKIAWRIMGLALQQSKMDSADRIRLPDLSHPSIKIWKAHMSKHTPQDRQLFESFGYADRDIISSNTAEYCVIRDGNESPNKLAGFAARDKAIWLLSVYGTYDQDARRARRYVEDRSGTFGWDLRTKGYHATGHGPLYLSNHPDAKDGILDMMSKAEAEKILILHTQKRKAVSEAIKSYKQMQNTKVIDRVNHPWTTIPITYS